MNFCWNECTQFLSQVAVSFNFHDFRFWINIIHYWISWIENVTVCSPTFWVDVWRFESIEWCVKSKKDWLMYNNFVNCASKWTRTMHAHWMITYLHTYAHHFCVLLCGRKRWKVQLGPSVKWKWSRTIHTHWMIAYIHPVKFVFFVRPFKRVHTFTTVVFFVQPFKFQFNLKLVLCVSTNATDVRRLLAD